MADTLGLAGNSSRPISQGKDAHTVQNAIRYKEHRLKLSVINPNHDIPRCFCIVRQTPGLESRYIDASSPFQESPACVELWPIERCDQPA